MVRRLKATRPPPPPPHTCEKCQRYYLSKKDLEDRHNEVDERFGDEDNCGGWTWDPPCGGCNGCYHMMVSHYFEKEREAADRAHAAGLEYADQKVIDTQKMAKAGGGHSWGSYHSAFDCLMAGEKN